MNTINIKNTIWILQSLGSGFASDSIVGWWKRKPSKDTLVDYVCDNNDMNSYDPINTDLDKILKDFGYKLSEIGEGYIKLG